MHCNVHVASEERATLQLARYVQPVMMPELPATAGTVGGHLRALREDRRRTIRDVATELDWSTAKLSRLENERTRISHHDLAALLAALGADDAERAVVNALRAESPSQSRRAANGLPDVYEKFLRLEQQAMRISVFGLAIIPGLLQIPEYAAAVIKGYPAPADFERTRFEARMIRQVVLGRIPAPHIEIVIDEAALRRPVGGIGVMRLQMLRLVEMYERGLEIRVVPLSAEAHPGTSGAFEILEFDDADRASDCIFCDGATGGIIRTKPEEVDWYRVCFGEIVNLSLSRPETIKLINEIALTLASQGAGSKPTPLSRA